MTGQRIANGRRGLLCWALAVLAIAGCSGNGSPARSGDARPSATGGPPSAADTEDLEAGVSLARTRGFTLLTVELYEDRRRAPAASHAVAALKQAVPAPRIQAALRQMVNLIDDSAPARSVAAAAGRVQRFTERAYEKISAGAGGGYQAGVFAALLNEAAQRYSDSLDTTGRRITDDEAYREAYALQSEARRRLLVLDTSLGAGGLAAVNEDLGVVTIAMPTSRPPKPAGATKAELQEAVSSAIADVAAAAG